MEEEVERISDEYGYPWDMVMDAVNYTDYDCNRVELMAEARCLSLFVKYCRQREALEEIYEIQKDVNRELEKENCRLKQERGCTVSDS
jgi:hypothetical protein